jgi:ZIP family zinc transporter
MGMFDGLGSGVICTSLGSLHPVLQAFLAGLFTWFITAVGAASVFFARRVNRRFLDAMLGFSGGVMLAASYWSLLAPAIEISEAGPLPKWIPPALGFIAGGAALWVLDKSLPHLHLGFPSQEAEGPKTTWRRSILLVSAVTLHNIPEGLAVGVAFGSVAANLPTASLGAAIALAVGIGIQNFPEGIAVAMPLRAEGMGQLKSFWFGQLSAFVEPLAAMTGAALVVVAAPILPYALSFAAGAMIYVVVEELIPEAERAGNVDLATITLMLGFVTMMTLDVALG